MPNRIVNFDNWYWQYADRVARDNRSANTAAAPWKSVESLPIATVRYDRNFCRVYVSPDYLHVIVSEKAAEILGKSIDELWWPTNISATAYRRVLEQVMFSGKESDVTLEWVDGEGRSVSYIEKLVPEYDASGEIVGVAVLVVDVSRMRRQHKIEIQRQRVFERLVHGDDLLAVLSQVALYVESAKPGAYCCIFLLDEQQQRLQTVVAPSIPGAEHTACDSMFRNTEGGAGVAADRSATTGATVFGDDACAGACFDAMRGIGVATYRSEPIYSSSRRLLGMLCLYLQQDVAPDQDDAALLLEAVQLSSTSIERKHLERQLHDQACYDPLTKLPNRRLFMKRLREEIVKAERGQYELAVLFIDLDHFKEVNDHWGHQAGDELLEQASRRIQTCVRESDSVARLGGDEFVIILPEFGNSRFFERVARDIVTVMTRPFYHAEHSATVSASIGIAIFPLDAADPEALIHHADQAMYSAKQRGRNTYSICSAVESESERRRAQLLEDLPGALTKGQFDVHYQPILDVRGGRVVKAEALLRWYHPELGPVAPDEFLPLAEASEVSVEIGTWVIQQAVATAKRWNASVDLDAPKQITVNMSSRQLTQGCGDQQVFDCLQAANLEPAHIGIEISERFLLGDSPVIAEKLDKLSARGIELSLDDFGTGISAITHIQKLNLGYLKIDRSVIRGLAVDSDKRAMVQAIIAMAQALGIRVIAKGVETRIQGNLLAEAGCELQQGYLYCRPLPGDAFIGFVGRV